MVADDRLFIHSECDSVSIPHSVMNVQSGISPKPIHFITSAFFRLSPSPAVWVSPRKITSDSRVANLSSGVENAGEVVGRTGGEDEYDER